MKQLIFLILFLPLVVCGQTVKTDTYLKQEADTIGNVIGGKSANNADRLRRMYKNIIASKPNKTKPFTLTTSGTSGVATLTDSTLNVPNYTAGTVTSLTTNNYSGGATLISGVLNIPVYGGPAKLLENCITVNSTPSAIHTIVRTSNATTFYKVTLVSRLNSGTDPTGQGSAQILVFTVTDVSGTGTVSGTLTTIYDYSPGNAAIITSVSCSGGNTIINAGCSGSNTYNVCVYVEYITN